MASFSSILSDIGNAIQKDFFRSRRGNRTTAAGPFVDTLFSGIFYNLFNSIVAEVSKVEAAAVLAQAHRTAQAHRRRRRLVPR